MACTPPAWRRSGVKHQQLKSGMPGPVHVRQAQLASSCTVLRWPHSVWTISWQTTVQQADQQVPGTNILDTAGWLIESKHGTRCQAEEQ